MKALLSDFTPDDSSHVDAQNEPENIYICTAKFAGLDGLLKHLECAGMCYCATK